MTRMTRVVRVVRVVRRGKRVAGALRLEFHVEWRYRVVAVAAILAVGWSGLLLAVPASAARTIGPFVLLVDTASFGAFFIALLVLYERGEGAFAALRVTPLRFGEYLAVKLMTLTVLSVASAVPIVVAAGRPGAPLPTLLGVGLAALVILSVSYLLVLSHRSVTGYLTAAPLVLLPGLAVPLAWLAGLVDHPSAYLIPTTGMAELIQSGIESGGWPPGGWWRPVLLLAYAGAWTAGVLALARRRYQRVFFDVGRPPAGGDPAGGDPSGGDPSGGDPSGGDPSGGESSGGDPSGRSRRRPGSGPDGGAARDVRADGGPARRGPFGWLVAFARLDLRVLGASRLLLVLLAAPLLLAVAIRIGYPPAVRLVDDRYGVDASGQAGLLLALLVLAHVPIIGGMVGSLLLLDDVDERRLLLLRVTPVTLERYLGYRAGGVWLLTLVGLLGAVPISGLATAALWRLTPVLLLAAGQAVLILLLVAAFAANKVHGLAILKLLGGVVMVAAAVPWFPLPTPLVEWPLLAAVPPIAVSLAQLAVESGEPGLAAAAVAVGAVATVVVGAGLARRAVARFTR
ncbi:hypothetical protein O7632_27455 [Solwaraspora sp. WMMD406]|uniref:fluoroquinolone export ABC transporter permease subunit n=1 Tax=Solwaraspora sp. WMMD406 TaxID=3016095 RepID=UPI00241680E9|nr:hypothetical protein [Solwaraspora sp. WMMD406]MDG4767802.1 hypothetical protein [Solwaraspora sp. WMMD406]